MDSPDDRDNALRRLLAAAVPDNPSGLTAHDAYVEFLNDRVADAKEALQKAEAERQRYASLSTDAAQRPAGMDALQDNDLRDLPQAIKGQSPDALIRKVETLVAQTKDIVDALSSTKLVDQVQAVNTPVCEREIAPKIDMICDTIRTVAIDVGAQNHLYSRISELQAESIASDQVRNNLRRKLDELQISYDLRGRELDSSAASVTSLQDAAKAASVRQTETDLEVARLKERSESCKQFHKAALSEAKVRNDELQERLADTRSKLALAESLKATASTAELERQLADAKAKAWGAEMIRAVINTNVQVVSDSSHKLGEQKARIAACQAELESVSEERDELLDGPDGGIAQVYHRLAQRTWGLVMETIHDEDRADPKRVALELVPYLQSGDIEDNLWDFMTHRLLDTWVCIEDVQQEGRGATRMHPCPQHWGNCLLVKVKMEDDQRVLQFKILDIITKLDSW